MVSAQEMVSWVGEFTVKQNKEEKLTSVEITNTYSFGLIVSYVKQAGQVSGQLQGGLG